MPDSPYGESLAIRTASSSPSCAITMSTGPKISSRATRALLSSPAMTVGSMKKPGVPVRGTCHRRRRTAALRDRESR